MSHFTKLQRAIDAADADHHGPDIIYLDRETAEAIRSAFTDLDEDAIAAAREAAKAMAAAGYTKPGNGRRLRAAIAAYLEHLRGFETKAATLWQRNQLSRDIGVTDDD